MDDPPYTAAFCIVGKSSSFFNKASAPEKLFNGVLRLKVIICSGDLDITLCAYYGFISDKRCTTPAADTGEKKTKEVIPKAGKIFHAANRNNTGS